MVFLIVTTAVLAAHSSPSLGMSVTLRGSEMACWLFPKNY